MQKLAIILVILVLVVGAIYLLSNREADISDEEAIENEIPADQALLDEEARLNSQSDSDDIGSIERDLSANSFESI